LFLQALLARQTDSGVSETNVDRSQNGAQSACLAPEQEVFCVKRKGCDCD